VPPHEKPLLIEKSLLIGEAKRGLCLLLAAAVAQEEVLPCKSTLLQLRSCLLRGRAMIGPHLLVTALPGTKLVVNLLMLRNDRILLNGDHVVSKHVSSSSTGTSLPSVVLLAFP